MQYMEIIEFWFSELKPPDWWKKSDSLDHLIRSRFGQVHASAVQGELYAWREKPLGRLAEIIILDQFSRNIYRGQKQAFAHDTVALVLSQEAVAARADLELEPHQKSFLYMPFMHSESKAIHTLAVELFSQRGLESNLEFELKHKTIIDRFGRYPHRNVILDRTSTPEEIAFLKLPGSSF